MNRDEFIEYLESPDKLNGDHVEDLKGLLQEYPYFQTAHMLLVKALDNLKDLKFGNQLKISAAHIGDRHILFNLVHQHKYSAHTQADQDIETGSVDFPDGRAGTGLPATETGISETEKLEAPGAGTGISETEALETALPEDGIPETEKPEAAGHETETPDSAVGKGDSLAERILREIEQYKKTHGPDMEPFAGGSEADSTTSEAVPEADPHPPDAVLEGDPHPPLAGSEADPHPPVAGSEADPHPPGTDSKTDEESSHPNEDFYQDVFLIDEDPEAGDSEGENPEIPAAGVNAAGATADAELLEIDKSPGAASPSPVLGPEGYSGEEAGLHEPENSSSLETGPGDVSESRGSGPEGYSGEEAGLHEPENSSSLETGPGDESRAAGPDEAVEKKNHKKPLNAEIESHSFSEWLDMFQPDYEQYGQAAESEPARRSPENDLIERFLREKPRIEPRSPLDDTDPPVDLAARMETIQDEFLTETLARIYVQQKHYKRAIYAYEKLCLKYPEKYSYFADQIDGIKRFINPDN